MKKGDRVNYAVIISDQHIGCQMGLMHPCGATLDGGGRAMPSPNQLVLWAWWQEFWDWVEDETRGEPYCVVNNGDALDGVHHNGTTQWSHNLTDQRKHAELILSPIVERCHGMYYHVRGTEAHAGIAGAEEEALAKNIGAVPSHGSWARWELWLQVGTGLAHFGHHIGVAGSSAYESSAVMRELSEAYVEAGRWGGPPPDWVVRSHRHRCIEIRLPCSRGRCTGITTPSWQLKTPLCYRVAGARQAQPQIGGALLHCGPRERYSQTWVQALSRPETEIPGVPEDAGNPRRPVASRTRKTGTKHRRRHV